MKGVSPTNKLNLLGKRFGKLTAFEELIERKNGHVVWKCKCDCGKIIKTTSHSLSCGIKISCGCNFKGIDLSNQRFGNLVAIHPLPKRKNRYIIWKCKCDCGNETEVSTGCLLNKSVKSCGCLSRRTLRNSPRWKGCGDISGRFWCQIKISAKRRNINFNLSIQDAWDLFLKQSGKCALSGLLINFDRDYCTASLDRIDSNGDYSMCNVQWTSKQVNIMKNDLPQDDFVRLCSLISNNIKHINTLPIF